MKNRILLLFLPIFILGVPFAYSEENTNLNNLAPQILTSDLLRKQVVFEPVKTVSFIFVDDDRITEIVINDVSQEFDPANTVVIDKKFQFEKGRSVIKVVAVDEAGNKREKSFLVGYDLENEKAPGVVKESDRLMWSVHVSAAYENDDNPTQDLSSPVKLGELEIQGVIPDEEQPDTRSVLKGSLFLNYSDVTGFIGVEDTSYSKAENDFLNSRAIYLGAVYSADLSESWKFLMGYTWMDINVGDHDFSQNHIFSPAFQFESSDKEGFYKDVIGIDYTVKDFASDSFEDGSEIVLKWVYDSLDAQQLDAYHRTFALGSVDDGTESSKHSYLSMDYDWYNRWLSGFKWDLGFGLQYRSYETEKPLTEETPLGSTRVDVPMRISTGLGWHFSTQFNVMLNYKYEFNLSNKSPYVRNIYGIKAIGRF